MICGPPAARTSITVIVSWPALATNARRPSGEMTTLAASAPVISSPLSPTRSSGSTWRSSGVSSRIRSTVTELPAALATKA